jgi:5'-3' exonuclease
MADESAESTSSQAGEKDTLYLLDGMALAYRAHFAFINRPIYNSRGMNTSALFGFTNTLLDLMETRNPSHMALVFDTDAPTKRHEIFPDYKGTRQKRPEDLSEALPRLDDLARGFNIPVLRQDGVEADDIIGTLAHRGPMRAWRCLWSRRTRISANWFDPASPCSSPVTRAATRRFWGSTRC